jgi:hypothetical protein
MDLQLDIAMAVCYIRMHKITKAIPYINEVLANTGKEDGQWQQQMINKFTEELMASTSNDDSPEPAQKMENREVGKTYWESMRKVFHDSLCNRENDLYKIWNNNVVKLLLSKKVIGCMLFSCLAFKLDTRLLAACISALIVKFGVEVFCEKCKSQK